MGPVGSRFITALMHAARPDISTLKEPELSRVLHDWWLTEDALRGLAETRRRIADLPAWVLDLAREHGVEIPTDAPEQPQQPVPAPLKPSNERPAV